MRYDLVPPTIEYDASKCVGCGLCQTVCPHRLFRMADKKAVLNESNRCMECGACSSNCPAGAIKVNAGVGCAVAVINDLLNQKENSCTDCKTEEKE